MNAQTLKQLNAGFRSFLDELFKECDEKQRDGVLFDEQVALKKFRRAFPKEFVSEEVLASLNGPGMTLEIAEELQRDKELYVDVRKELNRHRSREIVAELRDAQAVDAPWHDGFLSEINARELAWRCQGLVAEYS